MLFNKKRIHIDPIEVEKNEYIFYINNIREGSIVFDVGANIGELTLLFSKFCGSAGHVHSFEPTLKTFEILSQTLLQLEKKNVTVNNLAVSKKSGSILFHTYKKEFASWNTSAKRPLENYGIFIDKPTTHEIPSISINDYCKTNDIRHIDLLKIDVEGAELQVLQGAERMFLQKKIGLCTFEFGQTIFDMGTTVEQLKDFFSRVGYKISNVTPNQSLFPVNEKGDEAFFSVLCARPQ